jgi:hypothetical protein
MIVAALEFSDFTLSGNAVWFILQKSSCDVIGFIAYHAYLVIFLKTDACNWLCMSVCIFIVFHTR